TSTPARTKPPAPGTRPTGRSRPVHRPADTPPTPSICIDGSRCTPQIGPDLQPLHCPIVPSEHRPLLHQRLSHRPDPSSPDQANPCRTGAENPSSPTTRCQIPRNL